MVTIQYYTRRGTVLRQFTVETDLDPAVFLAELIALHAAFKAASRLDYMRGIALAPVVEA